MKTVHLYDVSNHEVSAESDYHQRGYLENYRFLWRVCDLLGDSLIIYNIKNSSLYVYWRYFIQGNERIGLKLTFQNKFKYGKDYLPVKITQFREKWFYNRETIRVIRISPLAKIPHKLSWIRKRVNYLICIEAKGDKKDIWCIS